MRRSAWIVLAVGCAAGCASSDPAHLTLQPLREVKAHDYDEILKRWTRKDTVYDGLDSKLFLWATFHSPEFRRAFLLRHTDVYGPGSEEASRLLLTSPEAEEHLEFFFSASTGSPAWNDFEKDNSIWRITLEGDDKEKVDGKVEKIKPTANLRVIYPYITDYAKTYAVRFPRTSASGKPVLSSSSNHFVLRMASALGTAKLEWKLQPTTSGAQPEAPPPPEERTPLPEKSPDPNEGGT